MPSSHSLFCLLTVRTIFPAGISMEAEDSSTWSTVQDTRPPTFSVSERTREPVTWLTSRVPSARASSSSRPWESAADSPSAAAGSSGLPSVPSASEPSGSVTSRSTSTVSPSCPVMGVRMMS